MIERRRPRAWRVGEAAVVLGVPVTDRGTRLIRGEGNPRVWGLVVRGIGACVDKGGALVLLREHHLGFNWRADPLGSPRGPYYYWGDLAPRDLVDALGLEIFLDLYTRR